MAVSVPRPDDNPVVAPPSFPRPARPVRPPKAITARAASKEGGVWAVIVGIDHYPGGAADLRAAAADARAVDAALAAYGVPPGRRVRLLDHEATADNIRAALMWLTTHAAADATAVFFYAGHVRQVSGDPDRDGEALDEAIVAADGNHVLDGEVARILAPLEARSAWIAIAACYGGGFDDALAPGRVLTAAATETNLAYENSALAHSYMVEYMVHRAMTQRHAPGSVQEAFTWAHAEITHDYPGREPVILDRAPRPVVLNHPSAPPARSPTTTGPPAGGSPTPPPSQPQPNPGPSPSPPPAQPPEDDSPDTSACTSILGMTICSDSSQNQTRARARERHRPP